MDTPGYIFLILCFLNPIDYFLRTIFHISDISLNIPSNANCKTNKIKGMKFCNSAQSSLNAQQVTSNEEPIAS